MVGNLNEQKFNDDLMIESRDQELARQGFPRLAPILIFPDLTSMFCCFEKDANKSKRACRSIGMIAVSLGGLALLGAAAAPLIERLEGPLPEVIGITLAILGVAGVCVGTFGIFFARSKSEWLCARLMTERLRQFHFQTLAFRVPSVLAAMRGGEDLEEYVHRRKEWLAKFELNYRGHLFGGLNQVLDDESEERFAIHTTENYSPPSQADSDLQTIFEAYRLFRYEHQIGYASVKLGEESTSQPRRQKSLLNAVSWISILVVFVLHLLAALSMRPGWLEFVKNAWVHVIVLWAAITALAARAFEEGLQPAREVARYSGYRAAMIALERSFDQAQTPAEKLQLMKITERVIYQEMRGFLTTNHEARFVL